MRHRNRGARQPRYRAVASWRQKIDVEALAQALLMLALHQAGQASGAARSGQVNKTAKSANDGSVESADAQVQRPGGGS